MNIGDLINELNKLPLTFSKRSMISSLKDSEDVDGTLASAQSTAIAGNVIRIYATDADIRFLIGVDPTALTSSHFLGDHQEIWMPLVPGEKVAILGGVANISTVV